MHLHMHNLRENPASLVRHEAQSIVGKSPGARVSAQPWRRQNVKNARGPLMSEAIGQYYA